MHTSTANGPWRILVVDDDRDIHALTSILLNDLTYDGRGVQFLYADSVELAIDILTDGGENIALVLLDMVMGERDAGLKVLETVRYKNMNKKTRFIVRTSIEETQPSEDKKSALDIDRCVVKSALTVPDLRQVLKESLERYRSFSGVKDAATFLLSIKQDLESMGPNDLTEQGQSKVQLLSETIQDYLNSIIA